MIRGDECPTSFLNRSRVVFTGRQNLLPHSEEEYQQLVALLDSMIDEVNTSAFLAQSHPTR